VGLESSVLCNVLGGGLVLRGFRRTILQLSGCVSKLLGIKHKMKDVP